MQHWYPASTIDPDYPFMEVIPEEDINGTYWLLRMYPDDRRKKVGPRIYHSHTPEQLASDFFHLTGGEELPFIPTPHGPIKKG